jgi:lysophospholipase L1-like esterase
MQAAARPVVSVLAALACLAACSGQTTVGPGPADARYYLSLGDSLAQGVQPDAAGISMDTGRGYPDQLYEMLHRRDPRLRLVRLGCPGETTGTMISGRHCPYPAGSQLAQAVAFLTAHRGRVALLTIDIGANDTDSCFTLPMPGPVPPCAAGPVPATARNLALILSRLRAAAGRRVTIVGMSLYDPELAGWRGGPAGRRAALTSARLALAFSGMLTRVYRAAGARVADVAGAFRSADLAGLVTVPGLGRMPGGVAAVCRWTWTCAPPPRGPNKHPNAAGYAVIARAFLAAAGSGS